MFFSVTELENRKIHFDVNYPAGELSFSPELRQDGNLHAAGTAELLRNTLGEIRIRGTMQARIISQCDRCLEDAAVQIDGPFDLFYRPTPEVNGHHEIRVAEGEVELSFYDGDGVALADVLREFILLSMPMQLVCRPDCRGICPVCGGNRNEVDCHCQAKAVDERWAALRKLAEG
jgi:uncharacterized protein